MRAFTRLIGKGLAVALVMLGVGVAYAAMLNSNLSDSVHISDSVSATVIPPSSVGGRTVPINMLGLLAPYIGLGLLTVGLLFGATLYKRRR